MQFHAAYSAAYRRAWRRFRQYQDDAEKRRTYDALFK
ncbi:unnamed protein product, partial [Amoebophrya sp. A120]|eukprot:GSA120T00025510001.1